MSRELKRVALNFGWPLRKVWRGFICDLPPDSKTCKACDGRGYSPEAKRIHDEFYDSDNYGVTWQYVHGTGPDGQPAARPPWLIFGHTKRWEFDLTQDEVDMLVREGRYSVPGERIIEYRHNGGPRHWLRIRPVPMSRITPEQVNRHYQYESFGHDGINHWLLTTQRAKRLGVPVDCPACKGKGHGRAPRWLKKAHATWKKTEPPAGPGYQLWETVSEGSPISPVFSDGMALAEWMIHHGEASTIEAAMRFLDAGWVPSMVMVNGKISSNADIMVAFDEADDHEVTGFSADHAIIDDPEA